MRLSAQDAPFNGAPAPSAHLKNPYSGQQAAAAAGRARYHALFNETRVARYVLGVAFDNHNPADYEWPTLIA